VTRTPSPLAGLAILGLAALLLAGCRRANNPTPPSPPRGEGKGGKGGKGQPDAEAGPFAAGKKVFADNCARCHTIKGDFPAQSKKKTKGPELTGVSKKHDAAWLSAWIRDPSSKKEDTTMPAFDSKKISDDQLTALTQYLMSLK
jgi:mono/diheme cytochrome c family protein